MLRHQNILLRFQNRKRVHMQVVQQVHCQTQTHHAQQIQPFITLEERNIFHQGRNNKVFSSPKHAPIREYLAAIGYECLVGYWYLCKQVNRFEELMLQSEVVEYLEHSFLQITTQTIVNRIDTFIIYLQHKSAKIHQTYCFIIEH